MGRVSVQLDHTIRAMIGSGQILVLPSSLCWLKQEHLIIDFEVKRLAALIIIHLHLALGLGYALPS